MDEHKSRVTHIFVSLKELSSPANPTIKTECKELDILQQCLANFERNALRVNGKIGPMAPGPDFKCCLLKQYNRQVSGFEMELLNVSCSITAMEDAKELPNEES